MGKKNSKPFSVKRINGYLHKVTPVVDGAGKTVQYVVKPFMVELRPRDIMQIIVGASILAIPVGFTEEVWDLGSRLPMNNVLVLSAISLFFISLFVYFNFYRYALKSHIAEYITRVITTYLLSLIVVGILMTVIQVTPWGKDNLLAVKRIIIAAFPASMGATVSDAIK